jgi:iron(II)-dependent oxidoreductase
MGADPSEGRIGFDIGVDSIPRRRVSLRAFYIDRHEVTIGAYRKFVAATRHELPALWTDYEMFGYPAPEDDHPVVDVNWYDATAYCKWSGKRLPTEAEWEKAARGPDGRIWPWGDRFDPGFANTESRGRSFTTAVGALPKDVSPYGVYDMAGNAMEWTDSLYQTYPGGMKKVIVDERFRILRGGAWDLLGTPFSRAAHREYRLADLAQPDFGFRCAKDAPSAP